MSKITYTDKVALNINPDVADVNKCNATDLNEIKQVVNNNDDDFNTLNTNVGDLTQLETTEKNSIVGAINEVRKNSTYSTQEIIIGTWINGKPLYRKAFNFSLGNTTRSWSTIGTIDNIEKPVRFYGMCWNGTVNFSIPRAYDDEDITLYCDTGTKLFREQHNYSYANNLPAFAIIEYTKTTD